MKPTAVMDIKRTGDFGGEKIAMKIDPNAAAHLMSILTDLYSDAELAVIREYSTNAWDSHIEAGTTRPIEITLPNSMSPYFKVKDYGIGMDTADIESIYSQYGASTKQGTNTQTGMLGLGCKSALTYTSQFSVVGVKNGIKTTAVVSRIEDGTGVMEIVDTAATSEPNGVEISIPVKSGNEFEKKARGFFQFWADGTVLVNGAAPARIKGMEVTDNILLVSANSGQVSSDIIVMGGVPYPVEDSGLFTGYRSWNSFRIVAFVEIGEINFTPSREALATTPMTKETILRLREEFTAGLRKQVQEQVDAEPTHHDARETYTEWEKMLGSAIPTGITYNGEEILRDFSGMFVFAKQPGYGMKPSKYGRIDDKTIKSSIIITGFDPEGDVTINLRHRKKVEILADEKGWTEFSYVFCENTPGLPWVVTDKVVTWAEVKAVKIPSTSTKGTKKVTEYDVYVNGYISTVKVTDIDTTKPVYYHNPRTKFSTGTIKKLTAIIGDATLMKLPENRVERFKRTFPNAETIHNLVKRRYIETQNALTADDKKNLGMSYHDKGVLSVLDETQIDDPTVVEGIKVAKGMSSTSTLSDYLSWQEAYGACGWYASNVGVSHDFLAAYPLIGNSYNINVAHATLYINAVYAATQNGAI